MLATDWLSDVSQCLEDTLEAGELDETDDIGVSLVEELLTDFLQLIHGTIRNLIPAENDESDDENDRAVQNTVSGSTRDGANDPTSTNPNNPLLKRGPGKDFCLFFLHFLLFKPSVFFYHILT